MEVLTPDLEDNGQMTFGDVSGFNSEELNSLMKGVHGVCVFGDVKRGTLIWDVWLL